MYFMTTDARPIVATLRVGDWYRYNFAGSPAGGGTFVGWTDFGWIVFADGEEQACFYNPALLCTITPDSFDPGRTS